MTFDEIQALLGETATNRLTEIVLLLNQATDAQSDPTVHNRALREILSTMLALTVVSAPESVYGTDAVSQTSDRFEEIAHQMFEVRNDPTITAPVLN